MKKCKIWFGGSDYAVDGKADESLLRAAENFTTKRDCYMVRRYDEFEKDNVLLRNVLSSMQNY